VRAVVGERDGAAAAVRPVFAAIGRKTVWPGEAGQGSRMKLVVNAYMSILIDGVAEALELAGRLGIDAAKLAEAIEGGPLDAPIADAKLHKMERGDFAPEFPLEWALKDVDLAIGAAGDDELPLLAALSRQWRAAVDAGPNRTGRPPVSTEIAALIERLATRESLLRREMWTLNGTDIDWAHRKEGAHTAARQWAAALGMPRRVFALASGEAKPIYVDFNSRALVSILGRQIRAAGEAWVRFSHSRLI
jgi:hypothetical protein